TDLTTKPWVQEAGVEVLDQPFFARGNVATAGGCWASPYLAAWVIARTEGIEAARSALHYVAPVGEKEAYVANALAKISPYLPGGGASRRSRRMELHTWLIYLLAAVGLSLSPGPNGLLALTHGALYGRRKALYTVIGGCLGFTAVIALSLFGIGALLEASVVWLT